MPDKNNFWFPCKLKLSFFEITTTLGCGCALPRGAHRDCTIKALNFLLSSFSGTYTPPHSYELRQATIASSLPVSQFLYFSWAGTGYMLPYTLSQWARGGPTAWYSSFYLFLVFCIFFHSSSEYIASFNFLLQCYFSISIHFLCFPSILINIISSLDLNFFSIPVLLHYIAWRRNE